MRLEYKIECWKCLKPVSDIPIKIGFRATCPHCDSDQHVCKNCRYYSPGKPNDCLVPGTEYIRDREANNFCEDYKPRIPSKKTSSILGEPEKRDFNSLFKDP